MKDRERDSVHRFYREQLWLPGMRCEQDLRESDIEHLSRTLAYATWALANAMSDVKQAVRETLKRVLNKK